MLENLNRESGSHQELRLARLEKLIDRFDRYLDDLANAEKRIAYHCYDEFVRCAEENWDEFFKRKEIKFDASQARRFFRSKLGKRAARFADMNAVTEILPCDKEFLECTAPLADAVEEYLQLEMRKMAGKMNTELQAYVDSADDVLEQIYQELDRLRAEGLDLDEGRGHTSLDMYFFDNTLFCFGREDIAAVRVITAGAVTRAYLTCLAGLISFLLFYVTFFLETPQQLGNQLLLEGHKVRDAVVEELRSERELRLREIHDRGVSAVQRVRAGTIDALKARLARECEELAQKEGNAL